MLFLYAIFRFQNHLPLNPVGLGAVDQYVSFNTSASFITNTNWQAYGGETTMTYLSQMLALTFQNFVSAAVGHGRAGRAVPGLRPARRPTRSATSGATSSAAPSTSCCRSR